MHSKNLLTGEELNQKEMVELLELAEHLKLERRRGILRTELSGKTLALLFDKPSFRTKTSFTIGMHELGGYVVESVCQDRKQEDPEDLARVLNGYCHGVVLRTHEQSNLERMAQVSKVPILNGLSKSHHPCQVISDLFTLKEKFGSLEGLEVTYLGDGNNILHSLLLLAPQMGVHVRYSCPESYAPNSGILERALQKSQETPGSITCFTQPREAVQDCHAIYTDVWTSMGFENEKGEREAWFQDYQLNSSLYSLAAKGAVVMHCLPMEKGKEITAEMVEHPASVIFHQSENRLHLQKALLCKLLANEDSIY